MIGNNYCNKYGGVYMEVRRFDLSGKTLTKDDLARVRIPEDIVVLYNKIIDRVADYKNSGIRN